MASRANKKIKDSSNAQNVRRLKVQDDITRKYSS